MAAQVARDVYRTILVIGGGIAGVTAAIEAAEAGYDAVIVEKNPYRGARRPTIQVFSKTLSAVLRRRRDFCTSLGAYPQV